MDKQQSPGKQQQPNAETVSSHQPGFASVHPFLHPPEQSAIQFSVAAGTAAVFRADTPALQLAKGDKSKHNRKNRRLAKVMGLHPDEAGDSVSDINAAIDQQHDDEEENGQEEEAIQDDENDAEEVNALVNAAEALDGSFNWASPGGLLFYKTLFNHWDRYEAILLQQVHPQNEDLFKEQSEELKSLDANASEDDYTPIFIEIRKLIQLRQDGEDDDEQPAYVNVGNGFVSWLQSGTKPEYLNCWEAVLYACVEAGKLKRNDLWQYYNLLKMPDSEKVFRRFVLRRIDANFEKDGVVKAPGVDYYDDEEDIPQHMAIAGAAPGDILCFWNDGSLDHVAIYLGAGSCKSIWAEDTVHFETTTYLRLAALYGGNLQMEIVKI